MTSAFALRSAVWSMRRPAFLLVLAVFRAGCGESSSDPVGSDVPADAASDVPVVGDVLPDADPDVAPDVTPDVAPTGPVRFAVISDTHLGPSLTDMTGERWAAAIAEIKALEPAVDAVFDTGDNILALMADETQTQEYLDGAGDPPEMLAFYRQIIEENVPPMAYRIALGNHDDTYLGFFTEKALPLAAWLKAFDGTPYFPAAWYAVEQRGCLFVVLDSTDLATDDDSNREPTFGAPQLQWLDGELARGLPTVVFWHHWIDRPADGTEDAELNPLLPVLRAHKGNVKAAFTGHDHSWRRMEWEGIRFFQTSALFENAAPAYHLVECDPDAGTVTVLNEDEIPYL